MLLRIFLRFIVILHAICSAIYVPGVTPNEFSIGDSLEVGAVKLTSSNTQLPYRYYDLSFCAPENKKEYTADNIGEILRGDRLVNTPYIVKMAKDTPCQVLCTQHPIPKRDLSTFQSFISENYDVHLVIDNLIGSTMHENAEKSGANYFHGYKLGTKLGDKTYINNHLRFKLQYNTVDNVSLAYLKAKSGICPTVKSPVPFEHWQPINEDLDYLTFSYEVVWEPSNIRWASRWDVFLRSESGQVHWFAIINSLVIVMFLTGIIAMILIRTLRRDIAKYNRDDDVADLGCSEILHGSGRGLKTNLSNSFSSEDDQAVERNDQSDKAELSFAVINPLGMFPYPLGQVPETRIVYSEGLCGGFVFALMSTLFCIEDILEESGWKLVHGDIFRPPRYNRLLTALLGSGIQIFCMISIIIFFATLGMLSPTSRGAVMSAALFTYVFMGLFAGYYAGRFYKTMRGLLWKSTALLTAVLFPTVVLTLGLVLNSFVWYKRSSAAVPFTTMMSLLALWLGISLPLVFAGFFFGYRKRGYEVPVRTNQIPRAVPQPRLHQNLLVNTLLGGLLPFGAVFIEVFFLYLAIWESRFYYLFGFLFVVFIILIICCAQVAIVTTYTQLCNEDYRWWWRTFIASGGPAFYLFIYSIFYYCTKLDITQFVPTVIYFGYTILMTLAFWILTGTIGFMATFVFLRHIYSAIKID